MITTKQELRRAEKHLAHHYRKLSTLLKIDRPKDRMIPTLKARIRIIEAQIEYSNIN